MNDYTAEKLTEAAGKLAGLFQAIAENTSEIARQIRIHNERGEKHVIEVNDQMKRAEQREQKRDETMTQFIHGNSEIGNEIPIPFVIEIFDKNGKWLGRVPVEQFHWDHPAYGLPRMNVTRIT